MQHSRPDVIPHHRSHMTTDCGRYMAQLTFREYVANNLLCSQSAIPFWGRQGCQWSWRPWIQFQMCEVEKTMLYNQIRWWWVGCFQHMSQWAIRHICGTRRTLLLNVHGVTWFSMLIQKWSNIICLNMWVSLVACRLSLFASVMSTSNKMWGSNWC